jgi:hypothetical protein
MSANALKTLMVTCGHKRYESNTRANRKVSALIFSATIMHTQRNQNTGSVVSTTDHFVT